MKYSAFLFIVSVCCTSCGGGGSNGSSSQGQVDTLTEKISYHSNGEIASQGMLDQLDHKEGVWCWFYENTQTAVEAHFTDNSFDEHMYWIVYNADGSVRADYSDGTGFVFDKPWN